LHGGAAVHSGLKHPRLWAKSSNPDPCRRARCISVAYLAGGHLDWDRAEGGDGATHGPQDEVGDHRHERFDVPSRAVHHPLGFEDFVHPEVQPIVERRCDGRIQSVHPLWRAQYPLRVCATALARCGLTLDEHDSDTAPQQTRPLDHLRWRHATFLRLDLHRVQRVGDEGSGYARCRACDELPERLGERATRHAGQ
jgi:hypothetical protein